ncbi:MAG TPA: SH3 domain-containing protein [Thermoanaerobaculia bacterium]
MIAAALSCTQKPRPTSDADVSGIRPPVEIAYVGVPTLNVYAAPAANAQVTGKYGYSESISVLARKGEWSEIRSFDGTGWVKSAELMNAEQAKAFSDNAVPRFFVAPPAIPAKAHGEIVMQAKVNTEGDVYQVTTISNSTGILSLADQNAAALAQAKFFPLIDKGQRKAFTYEHRVYY